MVIPGKRCFRSQIADEVSSTIAFVAQSQQSTG